MKNKWWVRSTKKLVIFILSSAVTGCISIFAFAFLFGITAGIARFFCS